MELSVCSLRCNSRGDGVYERGNLGGEVSKQRQASTAIMNASMACADGGARYVTPARLDSEVLQRVLKDQREMQRRIT